MTNKEIVKVLILSLNYAMGMGLISKVEFDHSLEYLKSEPYVDSREIAGEYMYSKS